MKDQYILYQCLKDIGNHEECENEGPYACVWDNAWLGEGYYFWYHHIVLAKWWGHVRNQGRFVIYKSICENIEKCWDLHANPYHQEEFHKWLFKFKNRGVLDEERIAVSHVLEFIRNECSDFNYEAVKILGIDSMSDNSSKRYEMPRVKFEFPNEAEENVESQKYLSYMEVFPPVQVCLYNKDALDRKGFDVEFPLVYRKENRSGSVYI